LSNQTTGTYDWAICLCFGMDAMCVIQLIDNSTRWDRK